MLGACDVLVAEKDHAVLEQCLADLGHQAFVLGGRSQVNVGQLRTDGAGQRIDFHRAGQRAGADKGGCCANLVFHWEVSL
jgi:hypothetical protein